MDTPCESHSASVAERIGRLGLTPQQARVARLLAEGCSTAEIAVRLGIRQNTVKAHMTRVYARAGVRGVREFMVRMHIPA